jgi:hypothetical protein
MDRVRNGRERAAINRTQSRRCAWSGTRQTSRQRLDCMCLSTALLRTALMPHSEPLAIPISEFGITTMPTAFAGARRMRRSPGSRLNLSASSSPDSGRVQADAVAAGVEDALDPGDKGAAPSLGCWRSCISACNQCSTARPSGWPSCSQMECATVAISPRVGPPFRVFAADGDGLLVDFFGFFIRFCFWFSVVVQIRRPLVQTLSPSVELPFTVTGPFSPHLQPRTNGWSSPCSAM